MTDPSNMIDLSSSKGVVSFSNRLLTSPAFFELFERGMSLVEEAANYLDVEGRAQAKNMDRAASLAYATESMRLTTRLMQLASWLLLQRAVSEGEMTLAQAQEEQKKVTIKRQGIVSNPANWELLPDPLKDMIQRSMRLQEQVLHFDDALASSEKVMVQADNPLAGHLNLLAEAFTK
ncbi:MAG: DUF1465 family protein [Rhizobiales bacterium]|nr:DUF1465 family protein [Hyphomicrobiales bacterium]